ncbi:MAG: hypothetical protein ACP5JJ_13985 [Anaerolineae bacterium]
MSQPRSERPSADELISALNALGVHFLSGGESPPEAVLPPARLLAALAEQEDARLRLAIVPLLLYRPGLACTVPETLSLLTEPAQTRFKLFYTAAVLLQEEYAAPLEKLAGQQVRLPDLFSRELGIPSGGQPDARLKHLGERHRAVSGVAANWIGTYHHGAERLIRRLELEAQWAK